MNFSIIRNTGVFICCFAIALVNGYAFAYLNQRFFHYTSDDNGMNKFSEAEKFILVVILAPIVETALFNWLPNTILSKLKITNQFILILLPSIVFSLFHLYNPLYLFMAMVGGIIMNWYFLYLKRKSNEKIAFILVALLHATYNLYGFIFVNRY